MAQECRLKSRILFCQKPAVARPALFLDRDGVVIEDKHYISKPEDVELIPEVIRTIGYAKSKGFVIVIGTNQSGISRGLFDWEDYYLVSAKMIDLGGTQGCPDAIYANGFIDDGHSDWRKPGSGMILCACRDLNIDISSSVIIGDRWSDMLAGMNAGIGDAIMLETNEGETCRRTLSHRESFPTVTNAKRSDVYEVYCEMTNRHRGCVEGRLARTKGRREAKDLKGLDDYCPEIGF